uniref:Uncharacterized protein n=1 Tax=Arundo donax TaxID=35708 RepID=A0A0A8YJY3_ARUDO
MAAVHRCFLVERRRRTIFGAPSLIAAVAEPSTGAAPPFFSRSSASVLAGMVVRPRLISLVGLGVGTELTTIALLDDGC